MDSSVRMHFAEHSMSTIVQPSKDVPGEAICRNLNGPNNNAFFFGKADNWGESSNIDWDGINCAREDYRGVLLFLQGGLHFKSKPQPTFDKVIEPVITHPKYQECLRRGKILTIWSGLQSISPESAKKYPHQSRGNDCCSTRRFLDCFIQGTMFIWVQIC
mmetsp:Transcript_7110/g.15690  ORF Transcript_7110/g.15690 Transcript_7110/m.15690 type:complete len:160 (-) Transcript_7110:642-1121(-)